jgi:hypothetical protein
MRRYGLLQVHFKCISSVFQVCFKWVKINVGCEQSFNFHFPQALENYSVTEHMFAPHIKRCAQGAVGMPVGVQCITPPWKDEECLGLMAKVEEQVDFKSSRST